MKTEATHPQQAGTEILIVEDSATQAIHLESILKKHGHRVARASHGREAVQCLSRGRPAVIISDIQMPEMDGYELCRHVKADPALASIPFILITSLSAPQDIIRGLECGADNFIVKPYEEDFLLSRLRTVMVNHELAKNGNERGLPIEFAGERYVIESGRRQILNLLLSTYETAVKTNCALIEAQESLKAAQDQLIAAEKLQSVGRLAAGVAHEVKNPLAIMKMGIDFLASEAPSEAGAMILEELRQAVQRADEVVSNLMAVPAADEKGLQPHRIDALLARALASLETAIADAGIEVVTDYAPEAPACRIDAAKIELALRNVVANAIDAMLIGGTLTLRTRVRTLGAADVLFEPGNRSGSRLHEGEEVVVLEIQDTGPGIPPQELSKVFDPFYTTKPTGKGMGLGLTVTRKIVDSHGGRVAVRNGDKGGTLVTFHLRTA